MFQDAGETAANPQRMSGSGSVNQPFLLIALCVLYIGFGAVLGLIQGGLPAIIMSSGWGPGQAGWAYAFYMPFGLAFLWAPLVDRWKLPFMTHSTGWVMSMQAMTVLAVVGIAMVPGNAYGALIVLGFGAAIAMATMDLALDGIAVETVETRSRGWAAGTKMAGLAFGSMIGGGLLVARFETWGRETSFLILACLLTLIVFPFAFLKFPDGQKPRTQSRASLRRLFSDQTGRRRLLLLIAVSTIIFPISGVNRLMLVSLGVPLEKIGWLVGTLGPVGMIVASVVSIPLINKFGHRCALLVFGGISFVSIIFMLTGVNSGSQTAALLGAVVIGGSVSGIFIVYAAKILGWARGSQPVTDYAAYFGMGRFTAALAMLASAQLAQAIGWPLYFSIMTGAFVLLLIYFNKKDEE